MDTPMDSRRAQEVLQPVLAASVSMIVLSTFFLSLRILARTWIKRMALGWDDLMLGIAYVFTIGICSVGLKMRAIELRGNPPAWTTFTQEPEQIITQLIPLLKCQYALVQLNYAGLLFPKLSLLMLYLRVFSLDRPFRWATYFVAGLVTVPLVTFSLVSFFGCTPIRYAWDRTIPNGHCVSNNGLYRSAQAISVAQDIAILLLPLYPLWRLSATLERKLGLSCVFAVGGIGMIAAIVKLWEFAVHTSELLQPYITGKLITWVVVECPMYLIACSLAGCGPLYTASARYLQSSSLASAASYVGSEKMKTALGFARLGSDDSNGQHQAHSEGLKDVEANPHELQAMPESVLVKTDVTVSRSPDDRGRRI